MRRRSYWDGARDPVLRESASDACHAAPGDVFGADLGRNVDLKVFCGIDCAERHHDVAVVDEEGKLVAKRRIGDGLAGFNELVEMLAAAGDSATDPIPVTIETPRGLLVAALRSSGRRIYSFNPTAVACYRERLTVSRKKSDHADAMVFGQHPAHRCPRPPGAAAGQRTGSSRRRACPRSPGRHLAAHPGIERTTLASAGVPPRVPECFRWAQRQSDQCASTCRVGNRTNADSRAVLELLSRCGGPARLRRAGRSKLVEIVRRKPRGWANG